MLGASLGVRILSALYKTKNPNDVAEEILHSTHIVTRPNVIKLFTAVI
jgi:hypothetical protein